MSKRLLAEWEEQDGILLAWPHEQSDWFPVLAQVEPVYTEIAKQVSRFQRVLIIAPERRRVLEQLRSAGADMTRIAVFEIPTNDTWTRDFGPITVYENDAPVLLDFGFNGWGLKFPAYYDNQVTGSLADSGAFRELRMEKPGLILEGGSIESDGQGTILTTAECLLSRNRNPHLDRQELERELSIHLGATRFHWLENGYLAGDDTDSHIDTLARLAPDDTILYVRCDDKKDEHYGTFACMEVELQRLRTRDGKPYRLIPLPWPDAKFDDEGQRLPATYANFLVINGAVLVPTYADARDAAALAAIAEAFPGRAIIAIDCLPLILQHGSLHCVTMQLPKGVLP